MKYKVGVVSGKFRILHKAHKEVMLRATFEDIEELYIIIHDNEMVNRYGTISQLRVAIGDILSGIAMNYKIVICDDVFETIEEWEEYVISIIGHDNILMFNSKENYKNILLDNKYIECSNTHNVSASNIEKNPYNLEVYEDVAKEFMPYINKKIVISGVESSGKTEFSHKLAAIFNTVYSPEYGRVYARENLGNDDEAFTPKDFVYIAMEQIKQNNRYNKYAKRTLIIDTDCFVTLRFLYAYYEEYQKRGILTDEFETEYKLAESMIISICNSFKVDLTILLKPTGEYVNDGIRWKNQEQETRNKNFEKLRKIYDNFNVNYIIVDGENYLEKFKKVEKHINNVLKV